MINAIMSWIKESFDRCHVYWRAFTDPPSITAQELRTNRQIVVAAVRLKGDLLFHTLPDHFKVDPDILWAAVLKNKFVIAQVSTIPTLSNDKKFVIRAVKYDGLWLRFASKRLRADTDVVIAAVQQDRPSIQYVPSTMEHYRRVALAAVKKSGNVLPLLSAGVYRGIARLFKHQ